MPYTVSKLTDFSAAPLDGAVRELLSALDQESAAVASENDWKAFRDRWMARKNGILTQLNDLWLKAAPGPNKRDVGQRVNELKPKVEQTVDATLARIQSGMFSGKLAAERLDITLPGIRRPLGAEHPVIKTMNEMVGVFRNLGYSVEE
ncbi:MAG: phenylalanine--tRNA ligase subunit alpha, partial [Terriglobales bacterium]